MYCQTVHASLVFNQCVPPPLYTFLHAFGQCCRQDSSCFNFPRLSSAHSNYLTEVAAPDGWDRTMTLTTNPMMACSPDRTYITLCINVCVSAQFSWYSESYNYITVYLMDGLYILLAHLLYILYLASTFVGTSLLYLEGERQSAARRTEIASWSLFLCFCSSFCPLCMTLGMCSLEHY